MEPELITIIEGPTPDFMPHPHGWVQSIYEGPEETDVALVQLRTGNGNDIVERSEVAWKQGRPVRLDYPDDLRMRQQVDVVAMRLTQVDEGQLLLLWVALPYEYVVEDDGGDMGEDDEIDPDLPF
ncbi:hypothetical protein [Promineifilum sp.]|uniref:hypothetical protein n=1 Tax=Promineifilum sp. TaxID=2664178 RepID=UPI0035B0B297